MPLYVQSQFNIPQLIPPSTRGLIPLPHSKWVIPHPMTGKKSVAVLCFVLGRLNTDKTAMFRNILPAATLQHLRQCFSINVPQHFEVKCVYALHFILAGTEWLVMECDGTQYTGFNILLTVHPNTVFFFTNLIHKFFILIHLLYSSTCFEHYCAHLQEDNCINTASGIVTLFRWMFSTQIYDRTRVLLC